MTRNAAQASRILGIATAVPPFAYSQEQSQALALSLVPENQERARAMLGRVYRNSGIGRRHSIIPDFGSEATQRLLFPPSPDLRPAPSTARRNTLYARCAPGLALEAARSLLVDLDLDPASITHLVTASCTGFSAPGFDFALIRDLPLAPSTPRFNIGFMGCFAAFPALRLADHICRSEPDSRVLVLALELCSLHYAVDGPPDALVANSLFADGAAAALVAAGEGGGRPSLRLGPFSTRLIPGTESGMAWTIGETGFSMRLSGGVPTVLGSEALSIATGLLAVAERDQRDVRNWAIHPGGRAILDRLEEALSTGQGGLVHSRSILRDYGNMSSPTVLFVLREILEKGEAGTVFASAFGPGLTAEAGVMELER